MPLMTKALKAKLVEEVKKVLPKDWKASFSITNHSGLKMTVYEAPLLLTDLGKQYDENTQYVSAFHASTYRAESIKKADLRETMISIINAMDSKNQNETFDSDYGNIPEYYIHIEFGRYNKPFKSTIEKTIEKEVEELEV